MRITRVLVRCALCVRCREYSSGSGACRAVVTAVLELTLLESFVKLARKYSSYLVAARMDIALVATTTTVVQYSVSSTLFTLIRYDVIQHSTDHVLPTWYT